MDRRSVLGLTSIAALAALTGRTVAAADPTHPAPAHPDWVASTDRLPGDPTETIPLWPGTPPGGENVHLTLQLLERSPTPDQFHDRFVTDIQTPLLTVFRAPNPNGTALLIAPGGGYRRVVIDKEGFEAAHLFAAAGKTSFVLRYRLPGEGWASGADVPLQDAHRALRHIRAAADDYAIDRARIGVLGFSAGGHVAASLMTGFERKVYAPVDLADEHSARPDFAGLMYPVITMSPPLAHAGSREKQLGTSTGRPNEIAYSPDSQVTKAAPPTWITLAADDKEVDPENGLMMHTALRQAGVPVELHLFEEGGHGFGLRLIQGKPAAVWPDLFTAWGRRHGVF